MNKARFFVSILALIAFYGCADNKPFEVDLCPDNDSKTIPGVCGCGMPDLDTDGDGILDCVDSCPNDAEKIHPGVCGCGNSDDDTDGDSVPDCVDKCPDNKDKVDEGECGCDVSEEDGDNNGVVDCKEDKVDYCPDNPNKMKPEGACGCDDEIDSDEDGVPDCIDQCPQNAAKFEFGICGCEKDDVDSDGDGVLDCEDMCPDDRQKTKPGICDCGISDDDADGDTIPDCMNACENGAIDDKGNAKAFPGLCGCDKLDTPDNTSDEDRDGVINCLDTCPYNSTKSKESDGDCGVMDSDGDAVDDNVDACPYNPNIKFVKGSPEAEGIECSTYDEANNIFYIYNAHNFNDLINTTLPNVYSKITCSGSSDNCVSESGSKENNTEKVCEKSLWAYYSCSECVPEEYDPETGELIKSLICEDKKLMPLKKALTIELVNDINLIDILKTSLTTNGECSGEWKTNINLTNVVFKGQGKTISYKQNTNTCSLNFALFNKITLSEVSDLTVELNVSNLKSLPYPQAIFANEINSSVVSNIHVKGKLTTAFTGTGATSIGGIAGRVYSDYSQYQRSKIEGCDAQNIEVTSTATPAGDAVNIGGYFGHVKDASVSLSGKHRIKSVQSNKIAGGFFGVINITDKNDIINFEDAEFEVDSVSGNSACGFAHTLTVNNINSNPTEKREFAIKSFVANKVKANKSYAAGFVYSLSANLKNISSEIGLIDSPLNAAGFVYTSSGNTFANIKNSVNELKCQSENASADYQCAGFMFTSTSNVFEHIESHVEKMSSGKLGSGFINNVNTVFDLKNSTISVKELQAANAYGVYANFKVSGSENKIVIDGVHFSADRIASTGEIGGLFGNVPASVAVSLNNFSAFANLDGADLTKIHSVFGKIDDYVESKPSTISIKNSFLAISNAIDGVKQESFSLFDTITDKNKSTIDAEQIENSYFFDPGGQMKLTILADDPFGGHVSLVKPDGISDILKKLQDVDPHWNTKTYSFAGSSFSLPAYVPEAISTP